MSYIRAQQKPILYVVSSIGRLALAVAANLYFIVYLELHITGVVYATFTFTCIHGILLLGYSISQTGIRFSLDTAKEVISFSWPLMLAGILSFAATYSDRIFLKIHAGLAEVGIYSLAYKFGFMLVAIAWMPFEQAWDARRYDVVKQPNAIAIFQSTFRQTQLYAVFLALVFTLLSKDILLIMAAPEFHRAYVLVGVIICAYMFNILSSYCTFGIYYRKKTKYKAIAETISIALTFILYIILIPLYSSMGAALATVAGLGLRFFLVNYWATKLYDMQLEWGFIIKIISLAGALWATSVLIPLDVVPSVIFNSALLLTFCIAVYLLPIMHKEDKEVLAGLAQKGINFIRKRPAG